MNQAIATRPRKAISNSAYGSHLYQRGNIYYFRLALSPEERQNIGKQEIRVSLCTGYRQKALKMAQVLFAYCRLDGDNTLEKYEKLRNLPRLVSVISNRSAQISLQKMRELMSDLSVEPEDIVRQAEVSLPEIIENDTNKIDQILRQKEKKSLSIQTIQKRFLRYIKENLDYDATKVNWKPDTGNFCGETEVSLADIAHKIVVDSQKAFGERKREKDFDPSIIVHLVESGIFAENEIVPENCAIIVNEFFKAQAILFNLRESRENGDFIRELPITSMNIEDSAIFDTVSPFRQKIITSKTELFTAPIVERISPVSVAAKPMYSEMVKKYVERKIKDNGWKNRGLEDHKYRLRQLIDIIGDKPIDMISRDDMHEFVDNYKKLPPSRTKSKLYKNKTVNQLLKMDIKNSMSIGTANLAIQEISSFFEWCLRENYLDKSPARGLELKDDTLDLDKRLPFSHEQIEVIFSAENFNSKKFKNLSEFWAPLIGIYTGMRLEEICQLHTSDIYEWKHSGIYLIDINNKNDKEVKTKYAKRLIPVHSELINVGLLDYAAKIKKLGFDRLFPELHKTKGSRSYGQNVGQQFGRFLDRLPYEFDKKQTFHSFRHTVDQVYKEKNMLGPFFEQIFGHSAKQLATSQYGERLSPEKCKPFIEELCFPIKTDEIRWTEFTEKQLSHIQKNLELQSEHKA